MESATIWIADDQLRRSSATSQEAHLIWTRNDFRKVSLLFILTLDNGLYDAGVIGPEINETVRDPGFPYGLKEGERRGVNPAEHQNSSRERGCVIAPLT